ncbi:hypothetical protein M427DRAFT_28864 [Gonapodya prolifera JEL478]|uniref:Uncharacterized protein n=1 Tax=Gonapodya prolifera (strain JEL478) TaxID=1344416 RepID=A0A139ARM0_GONPJ|nr:hypothetical protein M427DRAFT_28864 [Gonapodya prolifera JEL478]|eukprot:KXS19397.1 hypothetical protein M427DRAFT_28864 [Gonapodya prolifera JEL478]
MTPATIKSLPLETLITIATFLCTRDMDASVWQHLDLGAPRGYRYHPKTYSLTTEARRLAIKDSELKELLDRIQKHFGIPLARVVRSVRLSGLDEVSLRAVKRLWNRCSGLVRLEARDFPNFDPNDLLGWFPDDTTSSADSESETSSDGDDANSASATSSDGDAASSRAGLPPSLFRTFKFTTGSNPKD